MLEGIKIEWRNEVTLTIDWLCYTLSVFVILYLITRHSLLLAGRLKSDDPIACGDCTKATCACLSELCFDKSEPSSRAFSERPPVADSSVGSKSISGSKRSTDADTKRGTIAKPILYGTFASLFAYFAFVSERVVCYMAQNTLGFLPFTYCRFSPAVCCDLYIIAKGCMYSVFVSRLHQSFHGSMYGINEKLIGALYVAVIAFVVVFGTLSTVYIRGKVVEISNSVTYCEPRVPDPILMASMSFETVFVSVVVYLFCASLSQMYKDFSKYTRESSEENADILLLPVKYLTLSIVAVLSTFAAHMLVGVANAEFVLPFDCVLNCASLLLMNGQWAPVYIWLCSPLLKCIVRTPWLPCTELTEAQLGSLVQSSSDAKPGAEAKSANSSQIPVESLGESQGSERMALEVSL